MQVVQDGQIILICDHCGAEILDDEYEETLDGEHFCNECLEELIYQQ